jgi:hypothetical protein
VIEVGARAGCNRRAWDPWLDKIDESMLMCDERDERFSVWRTLLRLT